ncbi:MAG: hypothetical protein DWQ29_23475 [Planctomycetota bacterium]|nr:MAG: hypothetical protein DWQ29_23475 [Planctomycetota bacterium]
MTIWDQLIAEDDEEIDPGVLAAYAEGRLDDDHRAQLRGQISRSPCAMELLDGIRSDLGETGRRNAAAVPFATVTDAQSRAPSRWKTALSPLLAAAAILMAVGVSFQNSQRQSAEIADLRGTVHELRSDLDERTDELLSVELEHAYTLSSESRPLMHTTHNRALVRMALADHASRGAEDLSPELKELRERQIATLVAGAVSRYGQVPDETNARAMLDLAAIYLAANELDEAQNYLGRARSAVPDETPELLNLEGAFLIAQADQQTGEEAERSLADAEDHLRRAAELAPGFAPAWFNLALLYESREDLTSAAQAWESYVNAEDDPELRELVRSARGIE